MASVFRNAILTGAFAAMSLSMHLPAVAQEQAVISEADRSAIDKILADWPNRPKLGAEQMLAKYGLPQEMTSERLIWHNQKPYKRITVTKAEHHHDFPKPHMDFVEHTISYDVPAKMADAVTAFDGSVTFDRTRGEMSARCDLEGHNILSLNLAHDVVTKAKSPEGAREAFGENVVADTQGKYPPYTTALQFEPKQDGVEFADVPTIPGSPIRPEATAESEGSMEGEILGFVGAIDENEIIAALVAGTKKLSPQVAEYAKTLHVEHGKNVEQTLKLGQKLKIAPLETEAVDKFRVKGAGELAALVTLDGDAFGKAYIDAMIKGHTEVIGMIDGQLLQNADNEDMKKHLTAMRESVSHHLDAGKKLQATMKN